MATRKASGFEDDVAEAVTTLAATLRDAYRQYWPRGDEADPSERHLSFGMALALRERGYTTYFEVPFEGYLDLVAVNWTTGREIAVEFKNLYAGGKQANSMARDIRRLRRWDGVEWPDRAVRRGVERKRMVLGSTWQPKTLADWAAVEVHRFETVRRAFGRDRSPQVWGSTKAALIRGSPNPQQWLLWVHW